MTHIWQQKISCRTALSLQTRTLFPFALFTSLTSRPDSTLASTHLAVDAFMQDGVQGVRVPWEPCCPRLQPCINRHRNVCKLHDRCVHVCTAAPNCQANAFQVNAAMQCSLLQSIQLKEFPWPINRGSGIMDFNYSEGLLGIVRETVLLEECKPRVRWRGEGSKNYPCLSGRCKAVLCIQLSRYWVS